MTDERRVTRVEVSIDDERGVYMISVAAELADMHPQTLRIYESKGLIQPKRSPKNTRLYSQRDVEMLRRIHQMTNEEGLNLAGVKRVLHLEAELERRQSELDELRARAAEDVDRVHRQYRRDLVPLSQAMVLYTEQQRRRG